MSKHTPEELGRAMQKTFLVKENAWIMYEMLKDALRQDSSDDCMNSELFEGITDLITLIEEGDEA